MSVPQQDHPIKIGDTFELDIVMAERDTETDPWSPLDLSGVEMVEFSIGVDKGKKTHIYLSTDVTPRVWLETEAISGDPVLPDGTYYVLKGLIPPSENRAWPKPKSDLPGWYYELTLQWSPEYRKSYMGGFLAVDLEVADETVTP